MRTCKGIFSIINLVLLEKFDWKPWKCVIWKFWFIHFPFFYPFLVKNVWILKISRKNPHICFYDDLQRNRNIFLCKMHQIIVFMMKFTWYSVGKRIQILWKIDQFFPQLGMINCLENRHFSMEFHSEGEFWHCHFTGNKLGPSNQVFQTK